MADENTQANEQTVKLDGVEVSLDDFKRISEEVSKDPEKRLKEKSPGVWIILERLNE